MLGTIVTVTVVGVEVGITVYNLNKLGMFDKLKAKFRKNSKPTIVEQPSVLQIELKENQCITIQCQTTETASI